MFLWFLLILVLNTGAIDSARILAVFPSTCKSHQNVFQPIIKNLVERGHYVVFITTMSSYPKNKTPDNLKEINLQNISFKNWQEEMEKTAEGGSKTWYGQLELSAYLGRNLLLKQLNSNEVKNIVNNKTNQFDLLLTESYMWIALMFSHRYRVPLLQISSMGFLYGNCHSIGAPDQLLFYPESLQQRYNNLTIFEKYTEVYSDLIIRRFIAIQDDYDDAAIKTFYDDAPGLNILKNNIHMIFVNTHALWNANRPVPLSVVYAYGVHQKPFNNLPKDLQSYLDDSVNGVVYVSFGTNVNPSQLPQEKIEIMLNVLSELPYNVLLKWDKEEIPGRPKNIRIGKWFPQADLLKHSNMKAFVTQAGLQSTDEAIAAGVPLIGIPILFDQWMNAEKYVRHGIGIKLEIGTLTHEEFRFAITTVIAEGSYRKNIIKLRNILYDQPMQPLDRVVWWTEYVLRHNGAHHLRAPAANMSWTEFFEADLLFIALSLSILITVALCVVIRTICYYLLLICRQIKIKFWRN